jgi:hypothetical protein
MTKHDPLAAWRNNPFFVLEVGTDATPTEVERAGQRLLALLAVGSTMAEGFDTPLGPAARDAEQVRHALAMLRDPEQRMLDELWATVVPVARETPGHDSTDPWEEAGRALGWSGKWPV